ncbi:MAG: hypothetical protein ACI9AD_001054 [Nitriliruptoraceae bacterium]
MTRIVLDPDDVNQGAVLTLTDGIVLNLPTATRAALGRASRQIARFRAVYADAYRPVDVATAERLAAGELKLEDVTPLHAAVAERHAELKDQPGRGAADVDPTALLDDQRWTTGGGVVRHLSELTPSHRRNLIGWLTRSSEALEVATREQLTPESRSHIRPADPWVAGTPLYRALAALDATTDSRALAMDEARQVARRISFEATGRWPSD